MKWLADFPTTNARVVVTLVLAIATGVRVVGMGWAPPVEWLWFLAGLAGIDVAQFGVKRATYRAEP